MASYRSLPDEKRKGGSYGILSCDYGITWSERIHTTVSAPHGPNLMADGSLIYLGKEFCSYGVEESEVVAAYKSTDDGLTWTRQGIVEIPEGFTLDNFHEPHVLELPDGRLIGMIRGQGAPVYHNFTIFICFSDDTGRTWTVPKSMDISGSPPHLLLHSSGAVVCVFGRRELPFGQRAIVSHDNGETWSDEYVLFNDAPDDLGYPASVELSDGSILTVYYQKYAPGEKCSLLYTKWWL